jgi:hypothetical protein
LVSAIFFAVTFIVHQINMNIEHFFSPINTFITELKRHKTVTQAFMGQLVRFLEFVIHNYFTRTFYTLQFYWYNIATAETIMKT